VTSTGTHVLPPVAAKKLAVIQYVANSQSKKPGFTHFKQPNCFPYPNRNHQISIQSLNTKTECDNMQKWDISVL
jgi:hypothetical protein